MTRRMTTIIAICLLIGIFVERSHGQFGAFTRITTETEQRHDIYVQILPVEGQDDKCRIIPPNAWQPMSTYLIVCREKVPPEKQDFRWYIWSRDRDRTGILSVTPLPPYGLDRYPNSSRVVSPMPNHVILDRSLLERSYIYIDSSDPVFDGGSRYCIDLSSYPLPEERTLRMRYSPAQGLGPAQGVMRRDPSDIFKVGGLYAGGTYYVWYTKSHVAHGYDATVWYATSRDGHTWAEKGEALPRGAEGSWDAQSVFTPNILEVGRKYYLFYTGVPKPFNNQGNKVTKSAIGIAVANSPDGPWQKLPDNPVLTCSDDPGHFDSMRVDDACLIVRGGKYWLYYKGRQWNDTPAHTRMGVAIAENPEGPYVKYQSSPVIRGGHEVLAWPLGDGVAALVNIGPEGIRKTVQYAPDGLTFSKMMDLDEVPKAPGAYRPVAFMDTGRGQMIAWGLHIGSREGSLPFLERFDCQWERAAASN